jgi:hypothetical protein
MHRVPGACFEHDALYFRPNCHLHLPFRFSSDSAAFPSRPKVPVSLFPRRVTRRACGLKGDSLAGVSRGVPLSRSLDLGAMRPNAKKQPRRVVAVRALLPRDIRRPLSTTGGVLAVVPAMRSRLCFLRPYTYFAHERKSRLRGLVASRIARRMGLVIFLTDGKLESGTIRDATRRRRASL